MLILFGIKTKREKEDVKYGQSNAFVYGRKMKNLGKSTTTKNKQNNLVLWLIMIATIKIGAKLQRMN